MLSDASYRVAEGGHASLPARVTRTHPFLDRYRDAEAELAADPDDARSAYADGVASGDLPAEPVWAGQAVGLIRDLPPAQELVGVLAAEAAAALARALAG